MQEGGEAGAPGVTAVEFSGEYPFAWLRYLDGALPIDLRMECFSPFIPLNTKDSGLPAVVFRFTAKNRGAEPIDVALMASAPNLVGWDGYAALTGPQHVEYFGNVNSRTGDTVQLATREGGGARDQRSVRPGNQ